MITEGNVPMRYVAIEVETIETFKYVVANSEDLKLIYVIGCRATKRMKIGITENIDKRFDEIQSLSPSELEICFQFASTNNELELYLHRKFRHLRLHGEWFQPDSD